MRFPSTAAALLGAAAVLLWGLAAADHAAAARLGVPPGPSGGDPAGYLMLVGTDIAGQDDVYPALGDLAQAVVVYIEVATPGVPLVVDLYDPGLFDPAGGAGQLDVNLDPTTGVGTMRYILFGPGAGGPDTVLADMRFGSDTAATDRATVQLFRDPRPAPGLYHLVCEIEETVEITQDISVFGVSVPGHQAYSFNLTMGEAIAGGATIEEPLTVHPSVMRPGSGQVPSGPVCGLRFVTFDLDAASPDMPPPLTRLTTRQGFTFPDDGIPASTDGMFSSTNVEGIDASPLDSDDHGIWSWAFSDLAVPENAQGGIPDVDLNAFSIQVLNHGAGPRDAFNFPNVPTRPPFAAGFFNPDDPRRLYLPEDDHSAPQRARLGHAAQVVGGFPVIAQDEVSTVEVTVTLDNPHPYELRMIQGETSVQPSAELTDPVLVSANGLNVSQTGRRFTFTADTVAPSSTVSFTYSIDVTPAGLGPFFVTGDGSTDFLSPAAPTVATYETDYVDPGGFELPFEVLGPICQIEAESVIPPCIVEVSLVPSTPLQVCPGTDVDLVGDDSVVHNCDDIGGERIFQWRANGEIVFGFPAASTITVTPYLDDTWTLDVACSTDPDGCIESESVTFDLHDGPVVTLTPPEEVTACLGEPVDLLADVTAVNPPLRDGTWRTDPPGAPGDGDTTLSISVTPDAGTTTYTYETFDALDCRGFASVAVTVVDPMPVIVPAEPTLCDPGEAPLTVEGTWDTIVWEAPDDAGVDGMTDVATVTATVVGATYTVHVTDANGCPGQASVTVAALPDDVPGSVGPSLRVAKLGSADLRLSWTDAPEPAADYEIVSLDCDSDLDGTCDTDPVEATLSGSPTTSATERPGLQAHVESLGQQRPSWLVYYKVRARSPCSMTPGPFYSP